MVRQFALPLALAGVIVAGGCAQTTPASSPAPAAPVADAPADIAAVNAARAAFMAGYEAGDAAAIGNLYTTDAVSESNNQPTLEGRDAIVASLKGMFEQVSVKATLVPDETKTLGTLGIDRGHYSVTATPKAGAPPITSEGRYLVVYRKDADGAWRAWRDFDNAHGTPATPKDAAPATAK
jgi:uncharacterized protein (TIGR02246 family)